MDELYHGTQEWKGNAMKVSQTRTVAVNVLQVDPSYQRTIDISRAKKIAANYNEDAFGAIVVGKREGGTLWVVDGQTRLEAAKFIGLERVVAAVFDSDGREHEAEVFKIINSDRRGVPIRLVYRASLLSGEKETKAINDIVVSCGFCVPDKNTKTWPNIVAVGALYNSFRKTDGTRRLEYLLRLIRSVWPSDPEALSGHVIEGLSYFVKKFEGSFSDKRLRSVLKKIRPAMLASDADAGRKLLGGGRAYAIARAIYTHYNKRISDKLIWED